MRPVTFLTHFRIPSLSLLSLLLPGWLRGRQCSESSASRTWTTAGRCTGCLALLATLRKPPATHTATLACSTSSGSHELVSTCWQLQPQAETLSSPRPASRPSRQRLLFVNQFPSLGRARGPACGGDLGPHSLYPGRNAEVG